MSEVIAEITPTGDGERFGPRQQFFGESDDLREAVFKFSLGPWLEQVDDFLQNERGVAPSVSEDHVAYCNRVRAWQESLTPQDYSGRLRGIVGKDIWHHSIREDIHKEESEIRP